MKKSLFQKYPLKLKKDFTPLRNILFLFLLLFFYIRPAYSESNIDFFFKGTSKYKDVVVKKVISADTFILSNDEKVKLIGLKAPEPPRRIIVDEDEDNRIGLEKMFPKEKKVVIDSSIEKKAFDFAKKLVQGKHARLEFDGQRKDRSDVTLCYLFLLDNGMFVNAEILRQGYANLSISPPNTKYEDKLKKAYNEARKEQRGLQGEY